MSPPSKQPQVYLVDDDPDVRTALTLRLKVEGLRVTACADAQSLIDQVDTETPGCLVLDVRLPDLDGLSLQRELQDRGIRMPIIFITGHGDIPMAVRAVSLGALDFLEKPFDDAALMEAVHRALTLDAAYRTAQVASAEIRQRLDLLTPREREVLDGLLEGKPNKLVARDLAVSVRTVEIHRANLMEKMQAKTPSHLARLVLSCK